MKDPKVKSNTNAGWRKTLECRRQYRHCIPKILVNNTNAQTHDKIHAEMYSGKAI